jgi:hypothetical protein
MGRFKPFFVEVKVFSKDTDKGDITVWQKKKKRELFEERGHHVDVPPDVGDQVKESLAQKGEDAEASW